MPKFHDVPVTTGGSPQGDAATASLDMSASFNSDPIWCATTDSGSLQVKMAAGTTAVGTFKLQRSNNPCDTQGWGPQGPTPPSGWDWTDWSGSSQAVSGTTGSPFDWDLVKVTCRWIRLVYTSTSGTGTGTGFYAQKGPG